MEILNYFEIILTILVTLGGIIAICWKWFSKLNTTLNNLNTSTQLLNSHFDRLDTDIDKLKYDISNHETRITVLEKIKH